MKLIGINSSVHKGGNTAVIIDTVFEEMNKAGRQFYPNLKRWKNKL